MVSVLHLADQGIVYKQGDTATSVFYIQSGRIKLVTFSLQGKAAMLGLLESACFFGEGCLLPDHPYRASDAISMGSSTILRFEEATLCRLLREDERFASAFLSSVVARSFRLEEDLFDHLFNSSEKRLARALLRLADGGSGNGSFATVPRVSQEALAQMIGASRSRVSQFLNKFRRLGFIEYDRDLQIRKSRLSAFLGSN